MLSLAVLHNKPMKATPDSKNEKEKQKAASPVLHRAGGLMVIKRSVCDKESFTRVFPMGLVQRIEGDHG